MFDRFDRRPSLQRRHSVATARNGAAVGPPTEVPLDGGVGSSLHRRHPGANRWCHAGVGLRYERASADQAQGGGG